MYFSVLKRLAGQVEDFLPRWTENMDDAGYLASTTAKREDCIIAYRWFLEPMLEAAESGRDPAFGELIENEGNWADKIIQTSRRHRSRGVTGDMFIGCFKGLVHAVLDMIDAGGEPQQDRAAAASVVRRWADAFETIIVRDWTTLTQKEANDHLDRANRTLTMEKCKCENIIDSISDLVFVLDTHGAVLEANRTAREYFKNDPAGVLIWNLLGLQGRSMKEVLDLYSRDAGREIAMDDGVWFDCTFAHLKEVSLSSDGYLAILKDVTEHVRQREILEAKVAERTEALQQEKKQLEEMNVTLRTVMKSVDNELEAYQANVEDIVRTAMLPALRTLYREKSESIRTSYLDILQDQLLKLTPGGGCDHHALLLKLTPMEMKVCQFIQAGATSKEIAEALNLSIVTIQTHRRNIRRKLDLQNRHVNLYTFLNRSGGVGVDEEKQ